MECNGNLGCAADNQGHGTHCAGTAGGTTYGVCVRGRKAMISATQCKPPAAIQYDTPTALSSAGSWWAESGFSLAGRSCDPRCAESGFGVVCRFCEVSGVASGRRATQRPIRGRSNLAKSFGLPNCRLKRRNICGRDPVSVASAGFVRSQA